MRILALLSAGLLASASFATPTMQVIASTVNGSASQVVAGEPSLRWWANASAFGRVQGSRNGLWYAFAGIIDDPSDRKQAWSLGQVDDPGTWITPFIEDRPWPLDSTRTIDDNRTSMGVQEDGGVIFGANASGATTSDDFILRFLNGSFSKIIQEGDTSGATNTPYVTVIGGCTVNPVTSEAIFHTGANSATANAAIETESGAAPIVRALTTVFWQSNPFTLVFLEPDRVRAGDSDQFLHQGRINAPTTEDSVVMLGTVVVAREGHLLPGEVSGSPVASLDTALGTSTISSDGARFTYRGSRASGADFAVFGRVLPTPTSALEIINEGVTITANSSEVWSDDGSNVFGGQAFQVAAVNSFGDKIVGGYTNAAVGQNYVLVLNNNEVLVRAGDPVDLNGNGQFDDDCFFNQVVSDNFVFSENNRVLMGATLRNGAGTVTGISVIAFDAPIPGDVNGDGEVGPADFSLLATAFGSFTGDPNFNAAADLNGDGEVGPADFAILAANFGRIR